MVIISMINTLWLWLTWLLNMASYSEFSHEKWWFSIVTLVHQRVKMKMLIWMMKTIEKYITGYISFQTKPFWSLPLPCDPLTRTCWWRKSSAVYVNSLDPRTGFQHRKWATPRINLMTTNNDFNRRGVPPTKYMLILSHPIVCLHAIHGG